MDSQSESTIKLPSFQKDLHALKEDIAYLSTKPDPYIDKIINAHNTTIQQKKQMITTTQDTIETLRASIKEREKDKEYYETKLPAMKEQLAILETEIRQHKEQNNDLEVKVKQARKDHQELKQKISRQQTALEASKRNLDKQQRQNRPELEACIKKTGLTIHALKENYLKFDFTLIDKDQPDKVFSFVLHMTKGSYQVPECNPMLPNLNDLVKDLQQHCDPFLFVKLVRQGFCSLSSSSSSTTSS
ncbi:chromosome segregation protein Spc25-domain-containing protein [Halteromyces radiatus]|uniref:chromosome segregation protein Spc25-domain-containing protein n=1 Tax=Halteromyces radiatus TaxID=101107 RepID=UPI0022208D8E|nr:chromosome segregation protein Spc25-domain-containing protein [Halteromyces radiatus]KAI8078801.1 chromosome segregation protein Spc25-domain-containing protein [Halteromyces radiatus]